MYTFGMKKSSLIGLGFGATSGVITTLGLITGLAVSTQSKSAVLGGIVTIAVADALSDAFGIHVSQESADDLCTKDIWVATYTTFLFKFLFAMSFLVPMIVFEMTVALVVSIIWGIALISATSVFAAHLHGKKVMPVVFEHVVITVLVLCASFLVGNIVNDLTSKYLLNV